MNDYCPGAVQSPQQGGGGLNRALPPRATWHITWDALRPDGSQPQFSAVSNYLKNVGYCPHIMWNPFTGYMEQYYPASQSARALAAWNEDGTVNVQIEVFFTPGCIVDGVKYATVADTPLKGWGTLLGWLDSLGIPREWPLGAPNWQGNSRDPAVWNSRGGHYGHCNVPDNTHTDPGPMPALTTITTESAVIKPSEEDDMAVFSEDEKNALFEATARNERRLAAIYDRVFGRDIQRWFNPDTGDVISEQREGYIPARSTDVHDVISTNNLIVSQNSRVLDAVAKVPGVDAATIQGLRDQLAAELRAATEGLKVTFVVEKDADKEAAQ